MTTRLRVAPIELAEANAFVVKHHRHHGYRDFHRFSLGVWQGDRLVGVAIVGRPKARLAGHPLEVLEVTKLCTDGTRNACSILYAAAARVGREMGYRRIQTYILDSEPGTSLRAAGWVCEGVAGGGAWNHNSDTMGLFGSNRRNAHPLGEKTRWAKVLSAEPGALNSALAPRAREPINTSHKALGEPAGPRGLSGSPGEYQSPGICHPASASPAVPAGARGPRE